MQLPRALRAAIEREAGRVPLARLIEAAEALSERYRGAKERRMVTEAERLAYVSVRMPATYAAIHRVLGELRGRAALSIESLLDLGAGPGTAGWAAAEQFESLRSITCLERDASLIALGKALLAEANAEPLRQAIWRQQNLAAESDWPAADLVVASYTLNELALPEALNVAGRAWAATQKALVILEPGTMNGFALLRQLRERLLSLGAHLLAPCPHAAACPMPAEDWCHFAARVERMPLHRRLKAGTLGHEDEKFSYLIFTRTPFPGPPARILRHPRHNPGFVRMTLCTQQAQLEPITVTKKEEETWRRARKAEWGDAW